MADLFMDLLNGNNSNAGTSFALRVKDFTSGATSARTAVGDRWKIMKSETPVSIGSATWTNKSPNVTLNSALTKNIDTCEAAWTHVSTNVTQSNPTTRKEGSKSIQFAVAAAFTTGQIAYNTIVSTDFSAKTKISFHILTNNSLASGVLSISLCSDTIGAVPVNTVTINQPLTSNVWAVVTFDNAGALGATIQSISLDALSDPGTTNIQLDNILACTDLTLSSVIGLSSSETSLALYPIKSINGTAVILESGKNQDGSATSRGYDGATVTATTYKVEPILVTVAAQSVQKAGTGDATSARVTYSGGWDQTNMTSQTGLTIARREDGQQWLAAGQNWNSFERIVFVGGGSNVWAVTGANNNLDSCGAIDGAGGGFSLATGIGMKITNCESYNHNGTGVLTAAPSNGYMSNIKAHNNGAAGITLTGGWWNGSNNLIAKNNSTNGLGLSSVSSTLYNVTVNDNGSSGVSSSGNTVSRIIGFTSSGHSANSAIIAGANNLLYVDNANCSEASPFSTQASLGRLQISRIGGDPASIRIYEGGNTLCIQINTSTVHGSATKAYEHSPQSVHISSTFPLRNQLQPFVNLGQGLVTFSIWVQRSNSTNVAAQIILRGGQDSGIANDLTAVASAGNNTWEQLSISFNPAQNVPIIIELQSWQTAGSGNVFFSDAKLQRSVYSEGANKLIRCDALDFNLFGEPFIDNVNPRQNMAARSILGRGIRV